MDDVLGRGAIVAIKSTFVTDKAILLPLAMRKPYPPEFWSSPEGSEYASLAEPFHLLESLTAVLKTILGEETITCLQTKYATLRDFVEKSTPTTQCNNVIGSPETCWICGGKIPEDGKNENLRPECEHVFPIAQALAFTGLYEHNLFEQISDDEHIDLPEAYLSGLKKEYKWAHRICNQVKNDAHFIKYDGSNFVINDDLIRNFLEQLIQTRSWGGGKKLSSYLALDGNLNNGMAILRGRVEAIREICNSIIVTVTQLGLTPLQHACSTAMYLKEYVASDANCGVVENIARTNPTIAGMAGLSLLNSSSTDGIVEYSKRTYLEIVSNKLFGVYCKLLRTFLKSSLINAADRARIIEKIAKVELLFQEGIIQEIRDIVPNLRLQLMIYLQRLGKFNSKKANSSHIWSRYQVLASQILFIIVIENTCNHFNTSVKSLLRSNITDSDIIEGMVDLIDSKEIGNIQKDILSEYYKRIYNVLLNTRDEPEVSVMIDLSRKKISEILSIIPDPTNDPLPNFFKRGGTRRKNKNKDTAK